MRFERRVLGVRLRSAAVAASLMFPGLFGCGDDQGTTDEVVSACELMVAGVRTCQEVLGGAGASGSCQGTTVPKCPDGATASCAAQTSQGTYVFYAYAGGNQDDLDAQCEAFENGLQASGDGNTPSTSTRTDVCSWSASGDDAANIGDEEGTCWLPGPPSDELLELAAPLPKTEEYGTPKLGLFSLFLNLEDQAGPFSCTEETAYAQGLKKFAIEIRSLEHVGASVGVWECGHSRSTSTGQFSVTFSELELTDGKITKYAGIIDAVCPPSSYVATYPVEGSMTFHVEFSGP